MDQELHDIVVSLKKQNANSVYELLKAQRRMAELEKKVEIIQQSILTLIKEKEDQIQKRNRLTIARLHELKRFLKTEK